MKNILIIATLLVCSHIQAAEQTIAASEAASKIGQTATIEMKVEGVANMGGTYVMNGKDNFFVVIDKEVVPVFSAAGIEDIEGHFTSKTIKVTGTLSEYKIKHKSSGKVLSLPSIKVSKVDQITIVPE